VTRGITALGTLVAAVVIAAPGMLMAARAPRTARHASGSVWDGVYTPEQAARGAAAYAATCARCHGTVLSGGEMSPPLAGGAFLSNWNGLSVGDLFERVRVTMPSDKPGSLARPLIADVLAHVLRMNGFPSGKAELDRKVEMLKEIKIEATKP
jgi:hypothetical protein